MAARATIAELLPRAEARLADVPDARREAEWLLADLLACSRTRLFSHPETEVPDEVVQRLWDSVARRQRGEPLAYVMGHADFRSLRLMVDGSVLIPRPETEWLVEAVLEALPERPLRVVDLGTGSGAIALSLATERPAWEVWACDADEAALQVARRNAEACDGGSVTFCHGSWYAALPAGITFDAVVSNPPYVARGAAGLEDSVADYEPSAALYAEREGLADLEHLVRTSRERLVTGGLLALEHGFDQGSALRDFLEQCGYTNIRTHHDPAGHERFTLAQWSGGAHAG